MMLETTRSAKFNVPILNRSNLRYARDLCIKYHNSSHSSNRTIYRLISQMPPRAPSRTNKRRAEETPAPSEPSKKTRKIPTNDSSKGSTTPRKSGPVLDLTTSVNNLEQYINPDALALFDQVDVCHLAFNTKCIGFSGISCRCHNILDIVFCVSTRSSYRWFESSF
jgi:hypothetical protein